MNQDQIFFEREGNAWFRRNKAVLLKEEKIDWPIYLLDLLSNKNEIDAALDLGCANGWRLNKIREKFKNIQCVGIDSSLAAVEDGKKRYPALELYHGTLSQIFLKSAFDLVIVYFVLHWVDRGTLVKSISEIDRVTKDGGFLMLGDFLPDFPHRRKYHHLPQEEVYTYKQDYAKIFESFGIYKEIVRVTFNHEKFNLKVQPCNSASRAFCTILQKSLNGFYIEI